MISRSQKPSTVCGIWLVSALLGLSPTAAHAGNSDSANGLAQAEVVSPLRAIPLADLSFGSLSVGSNENGSVRVTPDGGAPAYFGSATVQCSGGTGCAPHRAGFSVMGEADRTYIVALPASVTAYGQMTGTELLVDQLQMRSLNYPDASDGGRLDETGRDTFFIGGTLEVPAGTQSDLFRAELSVTVSYN